MISRPRSTMRRLFHLIKLIKRLRFLFLFFVLLLFCFSKALESQFELSRVTDLFFLILIICSLVLIGERGNKLLLLILGIAFIELLLIVISLWLAQSWVGVIKAFFATCYFSLMTAGCLHYTLADKTISVTTLFGSLSAYLFIGLAYAYLDLFVYMLDPGAFLGLVDRTENTMIYYSFVTLTTLGFGDIVPKSPIAQTLSWFESFTGQAYLAVLMGKLVGRYVADRLLHTQNLKTKIQN